VYGGTFTRIKVAGLNQNDVPKVWSYGDGRKELYYVDTKVGSTNWWWKGTVIIEFNGKGKDIYGRAWSGVRRCVINYLHEPSSSSTTPVMYTEGQGCSGDSGSASSPYKKQVEAFYKVYFGEDDSLRVLGAVDDADDSAQCLQGIMNGLKVNGTTGTVMKIIKVSWACNGVAIDKLNEVLKKYNNMVIR